MVPFSGRTLSVDTPQDLERARAMMQQDTLRRDYTGA
jgi:3-deoxy-manno-octulosonate cytidylyltransferase (CMP-KDO synthetase)